MNDHDYEECMKAIHQFHEDVIKGYLEKPNQKLDESIRNLSDWEFFLLSMLVLTDDFCQTEKKEKPHITEECLCCLEKQRLVGNDVTCTLIDESPCDWEEEDENRKS